METVQKYGAILRRYPAYWWPLALMGAGYGYYVQFAQDAWTPALGLAAVSALVVGSTADIASTWLAFRFKSHYDKRGLAFPNEEICAFLPPYPRLKDQLVSGSTIITVVAIPVVFVLPGAGFYGGILRLLAGIYNVNQAGKIRQRLRAFDTRQRRS